jgi:hypothetical protein
VRRQASARARRPTQTQACKVFFLYYATTIQEQALALMGEKEAASQALEGVFDTGALRAMMNGGESDDILAALATTLEAGKKDARAAWNVAKPKRSGTATTKPKPALLSRAWEQGLLFGIDAIPPSALMQA